MSAVESGSFSNTPPPSSTDKKRLILLVIILLIVGFCVFLLFYFLSRSISTSKQRATPLNVSPTPTPISFQTEQGSTIVPGETKLADTVYKDLAYEIYPTMSSASAKAAEGYTIQTFPQSDGTSKIIATPSVAGYGPIEAVAKSGQKAYIVLLSPIVGTDPAKLDLGDNFVVILDQEGRITKN